MSKLFKEKVRAMNGYEIVMAMIEGLENPSTKIDMTTYGSVYSGICYGCAATNTISKISGINWKPVHLNRGFFSRIQALKTEAAFLSSFESAIDCLRRGDFYGYNSYASNQGFAELPPSKNFGIEDVWLHLYNNNYKERLSKWREYAKHIKPKPLNLWERVKNFLKTLV